MSLKKLFLTLSLKTQIYFALFSITITCIFFTFSFVLILTKESISSKKISKKKYYYELQHKIITANIFFQNICILQYEQMTKMMNTQIYHFGTTYTKIIRKGMSKGEFSKRYSPSIYEEELNKSKLENYIILYYHCYSSSYETLFGMILNLIDSSAVVLTKHVRTIRIPYYGEDIILLSGYIYYLYRYFGYYSLDINAIKSLYDTYDNEQIYKYLTDKIIQHREEYKIYFEKYLRGELHFFEHMFSYTYNIFKIIIIKF